MQSMRVWPNAAEEVTELRLHCYRIKDNCVLGQSLRCRPWKLRPVTTAQSDTLIDYDVSHVTQRKQSDG